MRSIRVGVVEDDPVARRQVLEYLERFRQESGEDLVVTAFDEARSLMLHYSPVYDILLLDIEMAHMTGLEAARLVRERDRDVVIVFVTAAPQYAINGYEVQALSYLLKPVPWFAFREEMRRSVDMARRRADDALLVEVNSQRQRLVLSEIIYLESIRHTVVIHLQSGRITVSGALKDYEAQLADKDFYRSNSCYLVNMRHVMAVEDQDCVMSGGERLRISRPRKKSFLAALTDYMSDGPR